MNIFESYVGHIGYLSITGLSVNDIEPGFHFFVNEEQIQQFDHEVSSNNTSMKIAVLELSTKQWIINTFDVSFFLVHQESIDKLLSSIYETKPKTMIKLMDSYLSTELIQVAAEAQYLIYNHKRKPKSNGTI